MTMAIIGVISYQLTEDLPVHVMDFLEENSCDLATSNSFTPNTLLAVLGKLL